MENELQTVSNEDLWLEDALPNTFIVNWNNAIASWRADSDMDARGFLQVAISLIYQKLESHGWARRFLDSEVSFETFSELMELSKIGESSITYRHFVNAADKGLLLFSKSSPSASSSTPSNLGAQAALVDAFDNTRFVNQRAARWLLATLSKFACEYRIESRGWYAPVAAVINASMTGKSRLLLELQNLSVFVVCLCFRADPRPENRPVRTHRIADWATGSGEFKSTPLNPLLFTQQSCCLILVCLRKLLKWIDQQQQQQQQRQEQEQERLVVKGWSLDHLAKEWYSEQREEFWEDVWRQMEIAVRRNLDEPLKHKRKLNFDDITNAYEEEIKLIKKSIREKLLAMGVVLEDNHLHVLFVFDEARQLDSKGVDGTSRFVLFRRALRCISADISPSPLPNIFCVVTDTTSEVANLAPISLFDDSYRLRLGGMRLFPPVTLTFSLDIWWNEAKGVLVDPNHKTVAVLAQVCNQLDSQESSSAAVPVSKRGRGPSKVAFWTTLTPDIISSPRFMAMLGRPIFFGFLVKMIGEDTDGPVCSLMEFLQKKLLRRAAGEEPGVVAGREQMDEELLADFGRSDRKRGRDPKFFTQQQMLAVLGSIASIEVNAGSRMASELVSGHLRLVAAVSKLRKFVYTLEVSEPMLALAAHDLIIEGEVPWAVVIAKYIATQLNSSTEVGYRGELAFQILALMAWQKSWVALGTQMKYAFPAISVGTYLENLLGPRLTSLESSALALMDSVCGDGHVLARDELELLRTVIRSLGSDGVGSRQKWIFAGKLSDAELQSFKVKDFARFRSILASLSPGVKNACLQLNSFEAYEKLTSEFKNGQVRVYQFVKVIGEVSKHTLVEFFIRGSAIVCKNNQEVVDIIIPIFFPRFPGDVISASRMGSVVIQVKLRSHFVAEAEKMEWLDRTGSLAFLSNAQVPSVGLFCELGAARGAEASAPSHLDARQRAPDFTESQGPFVSELSVVDREYDESCGKVTGCRFGVFCRRLSVADIRDDKAAQEAFDRLLESLIDPSKSDNVDRLFQKDIRKMFSMQPYVTSAFKWDPISPHAPSGKKARREN